MGGITAHGYLKRIYELFTGGGGTIVVNASDIEIGAVELKDGATDTRVKVGVGSALVAGDNAVSAVDPVANAVLGTTADAAVTTNAVGSISAKIRGMVTHLLAISTVGGVTTGAAVITDANGTIQQYLRGLVVNVLLMITSLADLVQRSGREFQDSFTRPNDATPYAIGDVISATVGDTATTALRSLTLARAAGKPFMLVYIALRTDLTTFLPTCRVHFYTIPNTAVGGTALVGDNVSMVQSKNNIPVRIGYVDLPAMALGHAGDNYVGALNVDTRLVCLPTDDKLYYRIEIIGGTSITPTNNQTFYLTARSVDL